MGTARVDSLRCCAVVILFLLSTLIQGYSPSAEIDLDEPSEALLAPTPFGQTKLLSIGSFPDGANTNTRLSIDEGDALKTLDLQIQSASLPTSSGFSWTDSSDFSTNTVYDGMDVNSSSLSLLPQEWKWDFESATLGPEWTLGGNTNWNLQTSNVITGTQSVQAGNINANQESFLTMDVSSLPSISGSFQYEVSSESNFDYLLFCIDNTACSRFSGFSSQWSGLTGGTHTFNIPATAQTLTWKYLKDGSVDRNSDTAWIDDIILTPTGGSGNGLGSWVSVPFGPSLFGLGELKSFGFMHMDAFIPTGSIFEWQLLDASTNAIVPGFESITDTSFDLGMVDWETYPLLKLRIYMETSSGDLPSIHGIHFEGKIFEDFSDNPTELGWQLQGVNWANGNVSGTGTLKTSVYNVRSGFAGFDSNSILSSGAAVQYTLDGGTNWVDLQQGKQWLTSPAFTVQFRISFAGGQWNIETFDVEMIRTSVPEGLRIDIGMDGISDWSLEGDGIGRLGIQDRLKDGSIWQSQPSSTSNAATFTFLLPAAGVDAFEFGVASPLQPMISPFMTMSINGQDFMSSSLSTLQDLQVIQLSSSELLSMNNALSQASALGGAEGLPMVDVTLRLGSSSTATDVLLGAIFAPYDASLSLQFTSTDAVVIALNDALQSVTPVGESKELSVPIRMTSSGAIRMTVVQQTTQSSVEPVSISVSNVTDTFTPSTDWIEVSSTFDFTNLGVTDAETYVQDNSWSAELHLIGQTTESHTRCQMLSLPLTGTSINGCLNQATPMIWSLNGGDGEIRMLGSGSFLQVDHRFKFTEQWDDEESLAVSVNLIAPSGPMLPVSMSFGLGSSHGVENDVAVKNWAVVNPNLVSSIFSSPYLHPGETVLVEVELGFENVPSSSSPRTGSTLVRFLVDGSEVLSSSIIINGLVTFPWTVPVGQESVTLEIDVTPLNGQKIVFDVPNSAVFEFDTVAPELFDMSVSEFDHVDAKPRVSIDFIVADRPILPSHAKVHLWRSWIDDDNLDGTMQSEEVMIQAMQIPENLNRIQGRYSVEFDSSSAYSGSFFSGWLEVADPAGNMMSDSGTFEEPLFNVQINTDGSPQLGSAPGSWNNEDSLWIHPGESNRLNLPLWDLNGITDISSIELNLAGNQNEPVLIQWDATTEQCTSVNIFVDIESCVLLPSQSNQLFSSEGTFEVNFTLKWGFDPDVSLTRIPTVFIRDFLGQSNILSVPELSWKFSGELMVDPQTLSYSIQGDLVDTLGTWVQPREEIEVTGELTWYRSSRFVMQPVELIISLGNNEALADSLNGSFSTILTAPFASGSYGIHTQLRNPPNGAIDRSPTSSAAWFIVDDQVPNVVGITSPLFSIVLFESTWSSLDFEVLIQEEDRLNEETLLIHWAVHPRGIGLSSQSIINGNLPLSVIGGRAFGDKIPCGAVLDLDDLLTTSMRNDALELRVWVTGEDMAGHEINTAFNDIDAPLTVWVLEQRIAEYSFSTPEMKANDNIAAGDTVSLSVVISNSGLADGDAQIFVEIVESNGARTRIDARGIQIESGGTYVYSKDWTPDRAGTMWIEYQIINGPVAESETVYVDEQRSEGIFGSISSVNPALLVVIFLLTVSLVGLLIFGLKSPQPSQRGSNLAYSSKTVPSVSPTSAKQSPQPVTGPYGAPEQVASPGENPYK